MTATTRPRLLLVCGRAMRENRVDPAAMEHLGRFADWDWLPCEEDDGPEAKARLAARLDGINGLIIGRGAPRIDAGLMDGAPELKIIGELEGDRFAERIDVEAAWARGIRTVDTTNGSSYPVAEWALALILVVRRNAGARFRQIIAGDTRGAQRQRGDMRGMLTGKRVGLIGCGHIGRRLVELLRPFNAEVWVYDPYLPAEMADAVGVLPTALDKVLSACDVVVCLAPLTPKTKGMIGRRELALLKPGTALVNVSRGAIIDSQALIERLKEGDVYAGLDVFDPEPYPAESEIIQLLNVFLSPHFAGLTGDDYPHFARLMVDELERFFGGHRTLYDLAPRTLANRRGDEPG